MTAVSFEILEPRTFDEATAAAAARGPQAEILGGGTAVRLMMERGDIHPTALVSLGRIAGHDAIRRDGDALELGALVRLRAIERSDVVRAFCPALAHAAGLVGNVRVRHQAMLGGGLGAPDFAVDTPTMLLALDAELRLADARTVPLAAHLAAFARHANPPQLIASVRVPSLLAGARAAYHKLTPRSAEARPVATAAVVGLVDGAHRCHGLSIAVGGAVAVPVRVAAAEAIAAGRILDDARIGEIAAAAERAITPSGAASEPDWYRRAMVAVVVRHALVEVRDGAR